MSFTWNDENVALLRQLYEEGLVYQQIAIRLGTTLNSVKHKVQHLGLPGRNRPKRSKKDRYQNAGFNFHLASLRERPAERGVTDLATAESDPPLNECLDLEHLNGGCKWPIGAPIKFCGRKPCERGFGSYCELHAQRAYDGLPPLKTEPRSAER